MSRRCRALPVLLIVAALGACGDDGPRSALTSARRSVVAVASQSCMNPNVQRGVGVVIDDDLVVTAGHTVEGDLRALMVDGRAARIETLDRNSDLALLGVDGLDAVPIALAAQPPDDLVVLGPDPAIDTPVNVTVTSREVLVIEHATDRATYRRHVLAFTPGVVDGMSGSPLVDDEGRLAGITILSDDDTGEGIAATAGEVQTLLAAPPTAALLGNC